MADRRGEGGFSDQVITIRFHTKVTKGGRKLSVASLVAVGDGNGRVGLGYGKAAGVPLAIEKANKDARSDLVQVPMVGDTIAHECVGRHGAARVLLKPASPGTGVKAGKTVRAILQVLGVHNVLSKVFGNTNPVNVAKATMQALREMRPLEEVERLRGVSMHMFHPQADVAGEVVGTTETVEEPAERDEEPVEAEAEVAEEAEAAEAQDAEESAPDQEAADEAEEATEAEPEDSAETPEAEQEADEAPEDEAPEAEAEDTEQ